MRLIEHKSFRDKRYFSFNGKNFVPEEQTSHKSGFSVPIWQRMKAWMKQMFLPIGYPHSVTADYAGYQFFDSLQAVCSTVCGLLTTRAMLTNMGVGDAEATSLSAMLTWVLKDGTGMVGNILFTWRFAVNLDYDAKTWRFAADIFNDTGMLLELLTPLVNKQLSLGFMCVGTLFKSLCGICGGSTKSALTRHFAIKNNMADVSAKDSSQEMIISLVAMMFGSWFISLLDATVGDVRLANTLFTKVQVAMTVNWTMFFVLVALHLYTNYQACRHVVLNTLNRQRLEILVQDFIAQQGERKLKTCQQVSSEESILWWHISRAFWLNPPTVIGVSLKGLPIVDLAALERDGFVISTVVSAGTIKGFRVALLDQVTEETLVRVVFYTVMLKDRSDIMEALAEARKKLPEFMRLLKESKEWETSHYQVSFKDYGYRISFKDD